jgi:hypothetical protein
MSSIKVEPQFEAIAGTKLFRATNTDKEIIKAGETYYMCFQGVWFMSNTATGPWALATTIPAEIYQIPPSSPAHSVTYVTVQDSTPDYVTYAAYPGYTGLMIGWGCAVWGTGWYYPPYYWYGGYYPILLPVLPHLRIRCLVQPLHRLSTDCGKDLWTIRRRWFWSTI